MDSNQPEGNWSRQTFQSSSFLKGLGIEVGILIILAAIVLGVLNYFNIITIPFAPFLPRQTVTNNIISFPNKAVISKTVTYIGTVKSLKNDFLVIQNKGSVAHFQLLPTAKFLLLPIPLKSAPQQVGLSAIHVGNYVEMQMFLPVGRHMVIINRYKLTKAYFDYLNTSF